MSVFTRGADRREVRGLLDDTAQTPGDVRGILEDAGFGVAQQTSDRPPIKIESLTVNVFHQQRPTPEHPQRRGSPRSRGYLRLMEWFAERAAGAPTLAEVHQITARWRKSPYEVLMEDRARERS
jgi:hypothetical protein